MNTLFSFDATDFGANIDVPLMMLKIERLKRKHGVNDLKSIVVTEEQLYNLVDTNYFYRVIPTNFSPIPIDTLLGIPVKIIIN